MIEAVLTRDDAYQVATATNGTESLTLARSFDPDVVVLDLGLPGMDGVEVCRELRSFTDAYVLMLTGRDDEVDRLVGLAVGADDYMTKPFSTRELVARVQVLLRRPRGGIRSDDVARDSSSIELGDLQVDPLSREVRVGGRLIDLTKIEFDLLATLATRPEMVFTRRLLMDSVWGDDWYGDDHMISVHMANLRKKIDIGDTRHIKTVRGVGYRMNAPDAD
ncbi:UNVERIFIED_CONTAM: hypothetical protein GTU68_043052 [Idotea baltica]|nr:hypothetical protein [Idotea baltica]